MVCAVLVEVVLAVAASAWLDLPSTLDAKQARPPPTPEPLPHQLAVRLHVDNVILHRLSPRVQACVSCLQM